MIERIKEIIAKEKMTLTGFADVTNINATTLSHIINGRGKEKILQTPSTDVITKILSTFPNISADWLLMGKEPMYKDRYAGISLKPAALQPELSFPEETVKSPVTPAAPVQTQEMVDKTEELDLNLAAKQAIMPELSLSENIDKIVIFFKNKTYVTLKPEE
jgi:transcriptional regulator with XRE-family HTH domain